MNRSSNVVRVGWILALALVTGACVGGSSTALEGTRWRLVEVANQPVVATNQVNDAHLVFDAATQRAVGSGGCNRITGPFERNGKSLRFGPMISTKMACNTGMDTEQAFLTALEATRSAKIVGKQLQLIAEGGGVLARLEVESP